MNCGPRIGFPKIQVSKPHFTNYRGIEYLFETNKCNQLEIVPFLGKARWDPVTDIDFAVWRAANAISVAI